MCLVVIAWQKCADYPLIVAGNRDEFYERPTENAHWWPDNPNLVGGRDLQAGGTWLAIHRNGRFATITNFRDAKPSSERHRSRGHLITEFLNSEDSPIDYFKSINGSLYDGFNLLASDGKTLGWLSNRDGDVKILKPGIYGLSNSLLNSPQHKVKRSKTALNKLIQNNKINEKELLRLLYNKERAVTEEINANYLPFATAHAISAPFVTLNDYGTRSSSIVLCDSKGYWRLHERRFNKSGNHRGDSAFAFTVGEDR
jgi:uncharacterized protein with NRDE domain